MESWLGRQEAKNVVKGIAEITTSSMRTQSQPEPFAQTSDQGAREGKGLLNTESYCDEGESARGGRAWFK